MHRWRQCLVAVYPRESQCGFRSGRGTTDMLFAARQVQEKCREQSLDLYMVFVDLTKAFDSVSREGLWKLLLKAGCPPRVVKIIRSFHDGMMARVSDLGTTSEAFPMTNGTKQGCHGSTALLSHLLCSVPSLQELQQWSYDQIQKRRWHLQSPASKSSD